MSNVTKRAHARQVVDMNSIMRGKFGINRLLNIGIIMVTMSNADREDEVFNNP